MGRGGIWENLEVCLLVTTTGGAAGKERGGTRDAAQRPEVHRMPPAPAPERSGVVLKSGACRGRETPPLPDALTSLGLKLDSPAPSTLTASASVHPTSSNTCAAM